MKRILVLTGTTGFPLLEQSILSIVKSSEEYSFVLQTKNKVETHNLITHESFIDMKGLDISDLDGIIGHCGAGTTFWALDKNLPFLAVVDLDRADSHQQDLGLWISKHNYGLVIENKPVTSADLNLLLTKQFDSYKKDPFKFENFDSLICQK